MCEVGWGWNDIHRVCTCFFTSFFSWNSVNLSFYPHLPCYKCRSQDCTIKVWETTQGKLIRELKVNACLHTSIACIAFPHVAIKLLLIMCKRSQCPWHNNESIFYWPKLCLGGMRPWWESLRSL